MSPHHYLLAQLCDESYASGTVLSVSEVDVLLRKDGNKRILAVRGTEGNQVWPFNFSKEGLYNWIDIFRDFRFVPMNIGYGYVHRGFYLSASRWFWKYRSSLDLTEDKITCEYTITGHSKGAAEAVHMAILLHSYGFYIKEVVLFAEPKSLYKRSRASFDAIGCTATSYINHYDPIRFLPFWGKTCCDRTLVKGMPIGHSMRGYLAALKDLSEKVVDKVVEVKEKVIEKVGG